MSGKAYTMREMKAIVDYLTEHRLYGDFRGRKMWMDFASSKLTTRTWQSLKETFLKRILPDISNPYYKLTVEQIASFRHGTDLEARLNNKLEVQTVNCDSSSDTDKKDPQLLNPKNVKGGNDAGEGKPSNINDTRSSTDTVIIEQCYNTAEEIQKDLESPNRDNENANPSPIPCSTKSIRDYITYSEPLTPMLQEVLHDFASEDEGDEPPMQIVEYPEPLKNNDNPSTTETSKPANNDVIENGKDTDNSNNNKNKSNNEDSEGNKVNESVKSESNSIVDVDKSVDVNKSVDVDNSDDVQYIEDSEDITEPTVNKDDVAPDVSVEDVSKNNNEKSNHSTKSQNNSSSITDTIPNNQEAFEEKQKANEKTSEKQDLNNLSVLENKNGSRKRSKSKEPIRVMTPEKRICNDKTRGRKSQDRDITAQDEQTTAKSPEKNKTEVKAHTTDEKSKNSVETRDVISEKQKVCDNTTIDESVSISENNLPERHEEPQDAVKPNADEVSLMSEDDDSFKPRKRDKRTPQKRSSKLKKSSPRENYKEVINEIVVLKSHSESTSDHVIVSPKKSKASLRAAHNMHRDRALANVFGFTSATKSSHRKHKKNVKRLSSHRRVINTSSSEEWTSDTGTEYISPPRGRKNKHGKKYLKPKSARIMSLEEEGGLFVMYGKKIYPVVKDGKLMKNYVTYTPNNDSEDDESYWKLKYVEEKKKTDELTKLLQDNKKKERSPDIFNEAPIVQPNNCEKPPPVPEPPKEVIDKSVEQKVPVTEPVIKEPPPAPKTVKIQFMKDNETVQVEGHWSQIQPVLEQVVQILHKDPVPDARETVPEKISEERDSKKQKISRDSTPISTIQLDEDVNEKLNKIEEEIFQTIQERDLAENKQREDAGDNFVTKRKVGRPKLSSLTSTKANKATEPKKSLRSSDDTSVVTRRQPRTPKKYDNETREMSTNVGKISTRQSSRNSLTLEDNEDVIKYKFPSPPQPEQHRNKTTRKYTTKTTKRKYQIKTATIFSSPDNISIDSIESSQGYQDTDDSNLSIGLRKKRRFSLTVLNRGRAKNRRSSSRNIKIQKQDDISSDSNLSYVTAPLKSSQQSSSLNTEVYRTESYQMLFPKRKNSVEHLDMIEETTPVDNIDCFNKNDDASDTLTEKSSLTVHENKSLSPAFIEYAENSSNVTLPPSPVLSIVEKISLSKNELDNTKDIDMPGNSPEEEKQTMLNDYMALDVDMSVPLMEQECGLQESRRDAMECHFNLNVPESSPQLTDTLVNKVGAVNITEPTLSESIHQKLTNLLLESAKKIAKQMNKRSVNDEDMMEICEPEKQKAKAKKRCSTPRKRQSKRNSKSSIGDLQIEDEHVESCGNEKSDPPPMIIVTDAGENNNVTDNNIKKSERLRKKRDVIKVKIVKPKAKKKSSSVEQEGNVLQTDSGINDMESGIFLRGLDDSIDLIHNHSDTCLQAHDCISDSVEIIDDNAMSIISLNSNSAPTTKMRCASLTPTTEHRLSDICCENAQDAGNLFTATEMSQCNSNENSCIFKSPTNKNISSVNSLLTDDLSDEVSDQPNTSRVSKWYLLSEDEASNTNNIDMASNASNRFTMMSGYGSNLQEIFPITCAVPDLSTITEENTMKFIIDGNSKSQFNSPSLSNV